MGPELPSGNSSIFSTLNQSLAFHDSPEVFISSLSVTPAAPRILYSTPSPRKVVRARLLNRDVAIVSSYQICKDILSTEESTLESGNSTVTDENGNNASPATFSAHLAYRELMSNFFPLPHLLIESFPAHTQRRKQWGSSFALLPEDASSRIRDLSIEFFNGLVLESEIDLYKSMKVLSWQILLGTFLESYHDPAEFATVQNLQEAILAGQFSPFRVSIRTPFWSSPRDD
jgi:cytochrome P450